MEKMFLTRIIQSPLADRRYMMLLLKTKGYGRRAFTEGNRYTKMPLLIRKERHEIPTSTAVTKHT